MHVRRKKCLMLFIFISQKSFFRKRKNKKTYAMHVRKKRLVFFIFLFLKIIFLEKGNMQCKMRLTFFYCISQNHFLLGRKKYAMHVRKKRLVFFFYFFKIPFCVYFSEIESM